MCGSIRAYAESLDIHYGPPAPADITGVGRPSDHPDEAIVNFDNRTTIVEFEVPYAHGMPERGNVKQRGWYIKGAGIQGQNPLAIVLTGNTRYIAISGSVKAAAAYFAERGFDVLMVDHPGHGWSEGGSQVVMGDAVFRWLDQLETGVLSLGPGETIPVIRTDLLGNYTAKTKPVVFWGVSRGGYLSSKAMAMNYSQKPGGGHSAIDFTYDAAGNYDQAASEALSAARFGYNFRGTIEIGTNPDIAKYNSSPIFMLGIGITLEYRNTWYSNVYNTMHNWPGYMQVTSNQDQQTPDGVIDAYNNKLRGFKEILMYQGWHGIGVWWPDFLPYTLEKTYQFAKKIVLNDPPTDNHATTTLEQKVCKAKVPGKHAVFQGAEARFFRLLPPLELPEGVELPEPQQGAGKLAVAPAGYTLSPAFPNPFNSATHLEYSLPEAQQVKLVVFNVNGQVVDNLVDSWQNAGVYHVKWNARNLSAGVYFYQLQAGDFRETKRMLLLL